MSWNNFEHSIWKQFKKHGLEERDGFILTVSGGLDSMVMLQALKKLKPKAKLIVVHFHHGDSDQKEIQTYRDQALQIVQTSAESRGLAFYSGKSLEKLTSEDDFRQQRLQFFSQIKSDFPDSILTTAHHKDDLLETWLLKMIRGTGPESLENFKFWNGDVLRPLLSLTKAELTDYAKSEGVTWLEDPTNLQSDHLRNWLRNEWLQKLANKAPGSLGNLTSSLQRLLDEIHKDDETILINYQSPQKSTSTKACFDRTEFLQLSHSDQFKTLAKAIKGIGQREFSQGQLEEIIKRLDKNQKDLIFSVAGVNWFINAQQVMLELV